MAGLKYYERTKLLIELIKKKKTGSPRELANRLGVKERTVYRIMDDLRLIMDDGIIYSREERSYVFSQKNSQL